MDLEISNCSSSKTKGKHKTNRTVIYETQQFKQNNLNQISNSFAKIKKSRRNKISSLQKKKKLKRREFEKKVLLDSEKKAGSYDQCDNTTTDCIINEVGLFATAPLVKWSLLIPKVPSSTLTINFTLVEISFYGKR